MTDRRALNTSAAWVELTATGDDWDAADSDLLKAMFGQLDLFAPSRRAFSNWQVQVSSTAPRTQASDRRAGRWAQPSRSRAPTP